MSEEQPKNRARPIMRWAAFIVALVALIALAGIIYAWGHFWDFSTGTPSSESCTNCHTMNNYVDSLADSDLLVSLHASRDIGCVDCHDYGLADQIHDTLAFLQDDYEQPFMRARYDNDYCFQCHSHVSYDQLAWRSTDLGVSDAQAKGHEANPHQPPHYSELECHTCHRMHRPSTLLCWECHTYEFDSPDITTQ